MATTAVSLQIVPQSPAALPALRAADRDVASSLESVPADNTRRVYGTQWGLFDEWCDEVGLASLPVEPLTVVRSQDRRGSPGRRGGHHPRRMRALDANASAGA